MRDEKKSQFDQVCEVCWNLLIKTKEINKIYRFHGSFKKLSMVVKMQFSNSLAALAPSDLLRTLNIPPHPPASTLPLTIYKLKLVLYTDIWPLHFSKLNPEPSNSRKPPF